MVYKTENLAKGVNGLFIKNDRFNTTLISFNFYTPLSSTSAGENALLISLLSTCSNQYPDFAKLNYELNRLYGARLEAGVEKVGDCLLLRIAVSVINDNFTLEHESVIKAASNLLVKLIFEPKVTGGEFADEDLAREKRKLTEHIRGEKSEKRLYAKNRLIEEMFKGDPYGAYKYGTEEQVNALSAVEIYNAWKKLLQTAFINIQIVGSAVPTGLFDDIKTAFDGIERGEITDPRLCKPAAQAETVNTVCEKMDIAQGKLVMGFSSEICGDDDTALPLMLATDIFGGGPYSKLFSNVREKMSLCYYCSAASVRKKGFVTVESGVEAANAGKAEKEILNQLEAVKNGDFSDFEFNSSLKSICDSLNTYNDSQNSLDLWYALKAVNENIYSPEETAEKISSITREQVTSAAKGIKLHTVYKLLPKEDKNA